VIAGANDCVGADERFATTSSAYSAYVSWDAAQLYVAYEGPDIGSGGSQRWIHVYLDTDPGSGLGAAEGVTYNTQRPVFPSGFRPERVFAWRTDNVYQSLTTYAGGAWGAPDPAPPVTTFRAGNYVEFAIAFADLGAPARVGVVSLMINEQPMGEWSYAGLYAGSFVDGYYASIPVGFWLLVDRASAAAPNAPANRRP
jgi:hypothetical protein